MARKGLKNVMKLLERANSDVPIEQQFLDDLKKSIEVSDKKNARKPSQSFKPSSMNCKRQMYYTVMGIEAKNESNYTMIGICEAGTDRHERIQNAIAQMKDNGFDCTYVDVGEYVKSRGLPLEIVDKCGNETKLYDREHNVSFLCDGIIKYQGQYYIVEFKTESSFKWKDRKGVDPKHYNQARTYSWELNIDSVIFVYINRDIVDMKVYMYTVSQREREQIKTLISEVQSYVDRRQVPPKQQDLPNSQCAYCGFKEQCKKEGDYDY